MNDSNPSPHETPEEVLETEIRELENPNLPVTQGTLPTGGFFSSFAEPLIVLGAVAVAMLLLFSVRS